ncbi:MAG: MlaD family protein [Puniceicoccales bacterium]|jgi:paraquat-inducible protein B|nr:MlaD family protein [Puniceicoccales bacterium]
MKLSQSTAIGLLVCAAVVVFTLALVLFPTGEPMAGGSIHVLFFSESVNGLEIGAPVKLQGVCVGQVRHIAVDWGPEKKTMGAAVTIVLRAPNSNKASRGAVAELFRSPRVHHLVGSLQMESFVTGKLFIALEYDSAVLGDGNRIATRPSSLKNLSEQLIRMADGLGAIDFASLSHSLDAVLQGMAKMPWSEVGSALLDTVHAATALLDGEDIHRAANSFAATCGRMEDFFCFLQNGMTPVMVDVGMACRELGTTAAELRLLIDRGSPLPHAVETFFGDMGRAARAVRNFFDFLEQNPNALLMGRWEEEAR